MLLNPTLEKLQALKLTGMAQALDEQFKSSDINQLSFEERLGLMIDREATERWFQRSVPEVAKAVAGPESGQSRWPLSEANDRAGEDGFTGS